ncbi:MAG: hypothetical protein J6F31_02745 [Oscillospiraceae bacterium]|nr:hypothetical protein [Oscillospiraceae bacterium]
MKLYVKTGHEFMPLEAGLISMDVSFTGRRRTYPFIDGDRTLTLSGGHTVELRVMLPGDEVMVYLWENALNCGVVRVRVTEGSTSEEFDCAVSVKKMYESGFAGTEALIELKE